MRGRWDQFEQVAANLSDDPHQVFARPALRRATQRNAAAHCDLAEDASTVRVYWDHGATRFKSSFDGWKPIILAHLP